MINRRVFMVSAAAVLLAGCATTPLLEENARVSYSVQEVIVDTSQFKGVTGRTNDYSKAQIERDIRATLTNTLRKSAQGERPVDVAVSLTGVHLVSPGQSFLVGGTSSINGMLQVTDAKTGDVILEPTKVFGTAKGGYAPGGLIGALSTRKVDDDYRQTVVGFSSDIERNLFGTVSKSTTKPAGSASTAGISDADGAAPEAPKETTEEYNRRLKCRDTIKICT